MKTVARKLRFAASPMVIAVALGLLAPAALLDDEADAVARPSHGPSEDGVAADDEASESVTDVG